jgi:hypothetical protein
MHVYRGINNKPIHIFQLQKSITIYLVYICCNFYRCLFLQVDNLNLATILENYCFKTILIACKCMPLCKKMDCNVKSEPPTWMVSWFATLMTSSFSQRTWRTMSVMYVLFWTSLRKSNSMPY